MNFPFARIAFLSFSLVGCLSLVGLDNDYTDDLGKTKPSKGGEGGDGEGGGGGGSGGSGNKSGSGQGGAGSGQGGQTTAGQSGSGQGGAGQAGSQSGQGGMGEAGTSGNFFGGASGSCPPADPTGLPTCENADAKGHACIGCACNDKNLSTLCSPKYRTCKDDPACSKAMECLFRKCSINDCSALAPGNAKFNELFACFQGTCSASCSGSFL